MAKQKSFWLWLAVLAALFYVGSVFAETDPSSDDFTCSPTKPCKLGCCSNSGFCGMGPTFCGVGNCTSSCDQKSDCDPGWGASWSKSEKCPLNVCCSPFGFCGTTPEFCGTNKVTSPSCTGGSQVQNRVMGYYEGWSSTRECDGLFPEDIPAWGYTHLNYAFAFVDPNTFAVAPMQELDLTLMPRFTALKQQYPGLQTWISIGGWSMNDPDQPTAKTFSQLAASSSAQTAFFNSLISFMTTYGFDGVDIDWEYPVAPERSGSPADYANYVSFLRNLRAALGSGGHNYGLTLTLPSSYWYLQNFDIVSISQIVDWFNVMTYDLHGTWDSTDVWIGPYVYAHTNLTEIDQTMQLFWRNNIDPKKITLGLGFYGRSFTLTNPSCAAAGCPFSAGGSPGKCTASAGTLSFAEIGDIISDGATVTLDSAAAVKIVTWGGDQWVSYDDQDTLKLKVDYANDHCLGGVMVWAASLDTAIGDATQALAGATGRSSSALSLLSNVPSTIDRCIWGECGQNCPAGTAPAQRSDGQNRGNTGIYSDCTSGQTRNFCCPSNNMPTCTWRGTAPFCDGKCHDGEVEVATDTSATGKSCWTGHKVLCCTTTVSDTAYGECTWSGSAPICSVLEINSASCPSDKPNKLTTDKHGAGGDQPCLTGYKSFCCDSPTAFTNCGWWWKGQKFSSWPPFNPFARFLGVSCSSECPNGQTPVATDDSYCYWGGYVNFCCDSAEPTQGTGPPQQDAVCLLESGLGDSGIPDDTSDSVVEYDPFADDADDTVGTDPTCLKGSNSRALLRRGWSWADEDDDFGIAGNGTGTSLVHLDKRGNARNFQFCLTDPATLAIIYIIVRSLSYPSLGALPSTTTTVARNQPRSCSDNSVAIGQLSLRPGGQSYASEHVYELQSIVLLLRSMINGIFPDGTTQVPTMPFAIQNALFSNNGNGRWFQAASFTNGLSINDYLFNTLGSNKNTAHFLAAESRINARKAIWWVGDQVIGNKALKKMNGQQRVAAFQDVVASFNYVNTQAAQDALEDIRNDYMAAWQNIHNFFNNLGFNYNFMGVARAYDTAMLTYQVNTVRNFITTQIPMQIAWLQGPQGVQAVPNMFTRAALVTDLQNIQNTLNQWCGFFNNWIQNSGG